MIDIRSTIVPKSDQLNADDLIGGPRTIRVSRVSVLVSDQPVSIHFEGDNGKPYLPCKSMRRVLVNAWGPDGSAYVGRSMTLYRDDSVAFGGQQVGGIRISHLSHIERQMTMALTATRGSRKPFVVRPLAVDPEDAGPDLAGLAIEAEEAVARGMDAYVAFWGRLSKDQKRALLPDHEDRKRRAAEATVPATDHDPKTGEVFEQQAQQGGATEEKPAAEAVDWTARIAELKVGAKACADIQAFVEFKKANKATIDAMPDDVFPDWADFAEARAAELKGNA